MKLNYFNGKDVTFELFDEMDKFCALYAFFSNEIGRK